MKLRLKHLFCILFVLITLPAFATKPNNVKFDGEDLYQVYNNSNSPIQVTEFAVIGQDLINQNRKIDCVDQQGTSRCVNVLPDDSVTIQPGKSYTFKVTSAVKTQQTPFVRGALGINIFTPQGFDNYAQVILPVQVNYYGASITESTIDSTKETYQIGASTLSNKIVHPDYLLSVTMYNGAANQATTIIVSNAPASIPNKK